MDAFAGIFPIVQTPFDESGALDLESLRAEIGFCLLAGAHGVVIPAIASEFFMLSDAERFRVAEVVIDEVRGRAPVVIGTSAVSTHAAVAFTRHAVTHGADGVMALPPYVQRLSEIGTFDYYAAIADAADGLPVVIQNASPPLGTPMSIGSLLQLIDRMPSATYVKEEVVPGGQRMGALLQKAGKKLLGVFGGYDGIWLVSELDRGSCGNMPGSGLVDVHVKIYELYKAGRREEAEALSLRLLPLLNLGRQYGSSFAKEVLYRRGVIRSKAVRDPQSPPLDEHDRVDLDRFWRRLEPTIKG